MRCQALPLLILLLFAASASADVVDESLQRADALWDRTVEYAGSALDRARRLWREEHPQTAELWEQLIPRLDEVIVLQDRQRELPESAWFGEDRGSADAEIDQLLDEVSVILVGDNVLRERMRELSSAMAGNRAAISDLKRRRLTAPSDSMWRKTVADIDAEIDEREALLQEQQAALDELHAEMAIALRVMGLDIDATGLEFLMSTVVGDDVIDMALAFEQVRDLTEQLELLTADSDEDVAAARRYYGMYTVLLRTLDHMHAGLLDAITQDYRPRVAAIAERARELQHETRSLLALRANPVLSANLEAQQLTIAAAARYGDYLNGQQRQVELSRRQLARDIAIARNTYETVKMSGDLVALMQNSRQLLDRLFRLQVPPLRAFENLEMKREFQRLTSSLRGEAA
ncbi:MAG: hypothetical protein QNJ91_00860 [Gammaproteobacteria bacterium]|nr:hypothetical protein [Gammaproteobacteria bacterium]